MTSSANITFQEITGNRLFGEGALADVGAVAKSLNMTRAALLVDPLVSDLDAFSTLTRSLYDRAVGFEVFDQVSVEPTDKSFQDAAQFVADGGFDGVISLGGGSTIDTGKAANLYASAPATFQTYINAPLGEGLSPQRPLLPHIACPTTFGTGSEATGIAVFDWLEKAAKTGIMNPALVPDFAVVDPSVLASLPSAVIAASGLDAFSHAAEGYTALAAPKRPFGQRPLTQGANPWSDFYCLQAADLIGRYLPRGLSDITRDAEARLNLAMAGTLAGIGFGNSGCHIPHGMSYAVSGLVRGYRADGWVETAHSQGPLVPHGISVVLNAPAVYRFTGESNPERHDRLAQALGTTPEADTAPGEALASAFAKLLSQSGLPTGLGQIGYSQADLDALTAGAWPQKRLLNNTPKPLDKTQLRQLFEMSL